MTCEMLLEFRGRNPELVKTLFRRAGGPVHTALRGRTGNADPQRGAFHWSSAVKAVSILLVKSVLASKDTASRHTATLEGSGGSLASSLDYAISKGPIWTSDMFGRTEDGRSGIRRIFTRSNAERKYPGPVVLAVDSNNLPPSQVSIWWDGRRIAEAPDLAALCERLLIDAPGEITVSFPGSKEVATSKAA